jgi:hypothetical protein
MTTGRVDEEVDSVIPFFRGQEEAASRTVNPRWICWMKERIGTLERVAYRQYAIASFPIATSIFQFLSNDTRWMQNERFAATVRRKLEEFRCINSFRRDEQEAFMQFQESFGFKRYCVSRNKRGHRCRNRIRRKGCRCKLHQRRFIRAEQILQTATKMPDVLSSLAAAYAC